MWKVVLPAAPIASSFAMGMAFRLWFWETEQLVVGIVMLGTPLLLLALATLAPLRSNEVLRAPF